MTNQINRASSGSPENLNWIQKIENNIRDISTVTGDTLNDINQLEEKRVAVPPSLREKYDSLKGQVDSLNSIRTLSDKFFNEKTLTLKEKIELQSRILNHINYEKGNKELNRAFSELKEAMNNYLQETRIVSDINYLNNHLNKVESQSAVNPSNKAYREEITLIRWILNSINEANHLPESKQEKLNLKNKLSKMVTQFKKSGQFKGLTAYFEKRIQVLNSQLQKIEETTSVSRPKSVNSSSKITIKSIEKPLLTTPYNFDETSFEYELALIKVRANQHESTPVIQKNYTDLNLAIERFKPSDPTTPIRQPETLKDLQEMAKIVADSLKFIKSKGDEYKTLGHFFKEVANNLLEFADYFEKTLSRPDERPDDINALQLSRTKEEIKSALEETPNVVSIPRETSETSKSSLINKIISFLFEFASFTNSLMLYAIANRNKKK